MAEVKFVSSKGRAGSISLEYPLEVDGVVVDAINLRRMSAAQVVELADVETREGFDDAALFAMVCDQPAEVLRNLDADDWLTFREAVLDFLPRRFRAALGLPGNKPVNS